MKLITEKRLIVFQANYSAATPEACWNWNAGKNNLGYGYFHADKTSQYAHRVSWRIHRGVIPINACVLHRCDNSSCVNPSHLFLGDRIANNIDKVQKGRQAKGRPHSKTLKIFAARGENNGNAKILDRELTEIRRLYKKNTYSQASLAKMFNCNQSLISRIVNSVHRPSLCEVGLT